MGKYNLPPPSHCPINEFFSTNFPVMPGIRQSRDYFPCLLCFGFEREMMWDSFTSASAMLDICSICTFAPGV